ncbi:MAG: hypothetical protein ABH873_02720 [Candidatus Firestonebacteria bacterium]
MDGQKAAKSANNIVFCAPYVGETEFFKRGFNNYFVGKLGCTVFTFEYKYKSEDTRNRQKWYYYKESGWHDFIFKVQEKLIEDYGLEKRKLLIVGESGGGSMGQQMGIYNSDKVDAVASIGGEKYDRPKERSNVTWLMINTWGDKVTEANDEFSGQSSAIGMQVIRALTPPDWSKKTDKQYRHIPGKKAEELIFEFIKGIIDLRDNNNGVLPEVEKWPESRKETENKHIFFPSKSFQKLMETLPQDEIMTMIDGDFWKINVCEFNKESGDIIVFIHDPDFDSTEAMDDVYYLSEQGLTVFATPVYGECETDRPRIKKVIETALQSGKKRNKKIKIIGMLESGYLCLEEASSLNDGNIDRVTIINPKVPKCSKKADFKDKTLKVRCKFIYSAAYENNKDDFLGPRVSYEITNASKNFGTKWFPLLLKIAKDK